jgi:tetratricopeptide (TPR) repeat protein
MKKIVLAMLLVAAVTAVAQTPSAPAPAAPTSPAQATPAAPAQAAPAPAAPAQAAPAQAPPAKKEIKDPAEYNAYVGAAGQSDPAAQVSGFEAFLTQYPNSTFKEEALELLMVAYQKTGNQAKMIETAQKTLQVNPCNIRALALVAYAKQMAQSYADSGQAAEKGLQCWTTAVKPADTPAADWDKLRLQTTAIFNGAAGISAYQAGVGAYQAKDSANGAKDYTKAEPFLRAAVQADPTNLLQVYDLALADLGPGADDSSFVEGLFFIARASNLAQGAGKDQIAKFGKSKYVKYHGSEDGWSALLSQTATTQLPPANFTITKYVPPTPAQQAADLMKSKKVEEMSFAEYQLVLSEGTPEDAEKLWSALKGRPMDLAAHIISIDPPSKTTEHGKPVEAPTKLHLAGSSDDVDAKRADIDLTMSAALTPKQMPKEDTDFPFEGTPVSYVAKPFLMTMTDGALVVKSAPKPPVHKKPAAH